MYTGNSKFRTAFVIAMAASIIGILTALYAISNMIHLQTLLDSKNAEIQEKDAQAVRYQERVRTATNIEHHYCADVKGYGEDLLAVFSNSTKQGTEITSKITCLLRDGRAYDYTITWDPFNDGDEKAAQTFSVKPEQPVIIGPVR